MRIVTLLPSATEVVAALHLGDQLVGVSHECDFPSDLVAGKPIVTRSAIPHGLTAAEVDRIVSEKIHNGESLYDLDYDLLEQLKPDLIITQELCEVCAVSAPLVRDAICRLSSAPQLVSLEPTNMAEIFETLRTVANAAGVPERADEVIRKLTSRLAQISMRLSEALERPRVFGMEWLLPPFSAGHWVPEMVQCAGGVETLASAGEKSHRLDWDAITKANPQVIVVMPCGYNVDMIEAELAKTAMPQGWHDLSAVRNGNVYLVNANAYFSRPSPRIVEGIEVLAGILHPELFAAPQADDARRWKKPKVVTI